MKERHTYLKCKTFPGNKPRLKELAIVYKRIEFLFSTSCIYHANN